jgi:hypothetical protein
MDSLESIPGLSKSFKNRLSSISVARKDKLYSTVVYVEPDEEGLKLSKIRFLSNKD